jgi:hypothetical protein
MVALAAKEEVSISPAALDERQRRAGLKRKPAGPINTTRSSRTSTAPADVPETECAEPEEDTNSTANVDLRMTR